MKKIVFILIVFGVCYAQKNSNFGISYPLLKGFTSNNKLLFDDEKIVNPAAGLGIIAEVYYPIINEPYISIKLYLKFGFFGEITKSNAKSYGTRAMYLLINHTDEHNWFYGAGYGYANYDLFDFRETDQYKTNDNCIVFNGGKILFDHLKFELLYNFSLKHRELNKKTDNLEFNIGYIF